jgi:hypothetical protein
MLMQVGLTLNLQGLVGFVSATYDKSLKADCAVAQYIHCVNAPREVFSKSFAQPSH